MKVYRSIQQLPQRYPVVLTVGTFDGVHCGHQQIIKEVVFRAKKRSVNSLLLTFDPHPREIVKRGPMQYLTTLEERIELLKQFGLDITVVLPFTYEFSRMTSREFYEEYLNPYIAISEVVVGEDHMFGRDREAGIRELSRIGSEFKFLVSQVGPVTIDGKIVHSSVVRELLKSGDVEQAEKYLGRPYSVSGTVIRGDGMGERIGFPTANVQPSHTHKLVPQRGVYFVKVSLNGKHYYGMMNIGTRPTFYDGGQENLEIHIFDFDSEVYGVFITVEFLKRLRAERRFASKDELVNQLYKDKEKSLKYLSEIHQS